MLWLHPLEQQFSQKEDFPIMPKEGNLKMSKKLCPQVWEVCLCFLIPISFAMIALARPIVSVAFGKIHGGKSADYCTSRGILFYKYYFAWLAPNYGKSILCNGRYQDANGEFRYFHFHQYYFEHT